MTKWSTSCLPYWYLEQQHGRREWEIEPEVTLVQAKNLVYRLSYTSWNWIGWCSTLSTEYFKEFGNHDKGKIKIDLFQFNLFTLLKCSCTCVLLMLIWVEFVINIIYIIINIVIITIITNLPRSGKRWCSTQQNSMFSFLTELVQAFRAGRFSFLQVMGLI